MAYGLPWSEEFVRQLDDKEIHSEFVADQIRARIALFKFVHSVSRRGGDRHRPSWAIERTSVRMSSHGLKTRTTASSLCRRCLRSPQRLIFPCGSIFQNGKIGFVLLKTCPAGKSHVAALMLRDWLNRPRVRSRIVPRRRQPETWFQFLASLQEFARPNQKQMEDFRDYPIKAVALT